MNNNKQFEFNPYTQNCVEYSNIVTEYFKKKSQNNYKNASKDLLQYYVECLACCHCLTYVKEKLIGDPIDVRMFESVGWIMKENSNVGGENNVNPLILDYIRPQSEEDIIVAFNDDNNVPQNLKSRYEIGIVKRFDFSSKLQRMTIIGKNLNENHYKAYCKGSPEKIKELSNPSTIPANFEEVLNSYTTKGYRVLGMAAKSINLNLQQSQTITREEVEKDMIFLGLLIVQNKLKEKTKDSLAKYDKADLRMLMATGDNILTAICVSKDCNLIHQDQKMISCEIENEDGNDVLKWRPLEDDREKTEMKEDHSMISQNDSKNNNLKIRHNININDNNLDFEDTSYSINDLYPPQEPTAEAPTKPKIKINHHEEAKPIKEEPRFKKTYTTNSFKEPEKFPPLIIDDSEIPSNDDTFGIALTGITFERLSILNDNFKKNKLESLSSAHDAFRLILKNGRVFARMAPEHKALLVDSLKKEGFTTLMCGDGANDCSALRTAHVSVSLSPEEASIAANFTSREPDVSCIYELLREGKCSLTTSIQTFKYMMLYSMIQFICVTLCMIYTTYLTDFQFLVSDLFIIFPLEWFLAMTKPYHILTHHYPINSLISFPVLSSIITHSLIEFAFQFGGYKILKNHYKWDIICDFDEDDKPYPCHENTIIFLLSLYQYLGSAIAFFVSKPFRQRLYMNWLVMIYLAGAYFYCIWITINCDSWSKNLFDIYDLEKRGSIDDEEEEDGEEEVGEEEGEEEMVEEEDIIEGGKKMKYWILLIAGINTIINIVFEWVVMKLVNNCYELSLIRSYKKEIEEYNLQKKNRLPNQEIKDYEIYKYQRVYYHERRQSMK